MKAESKKGSQMCSIGRCWVSQRKGLGQFCRAHCPRHPLWCLLAWGCFPSWALSTSWPTSPSVSISSSQIFLLCLLWEGKFLFPLAVFLLISWVMLSTGLLSCWKEVLPSQVGAPSQLQDLWVPGSVGPVLAKSNTYTSSPCAACWPPNLPCLQCDKEGFSLSALITAHSSSLLLFLICFVHLIRGWALMKPTLTSKRKCYKVLSDISTRVIFGQHPSKTYDICPAC